MKKIRPSKVGTYGILGSIAIALALVLTSQHFHKPSHPSVATLPQQAGEAMTNETYLKGGSLQRDLSDTAKPQEFITVETGTEVPRYVTREFTVHTGKVVSVTLRNRSRVNHTHNWVLVLPGTREKVQEAARSTLQFWHWIPDTPDILAFVPMTAPGQSSTRLFRAPDKPGNYPFLCSYPGHGNAMNGTLHVLEE